MSRLEFNRPGIAVFDSGARVLIYPGEHESDETFSGELLDPTEHEMLGGAHVSCMWDRSKVVRVERRRLAV